MNIIKTTLISLLFMPPLVFAQNQAVLPNAGLTPESPFYLIDRFGEALREFFTFNPESKARLQITFAGERIAEIKVILEKKGVEAKGLDVAKSRLLAHVAAAAVIVSEQKLEGEDVKELAKELNTKIDSSKLALLQGFKEEEKKLEAREDELKAELKAAHRAGDTAKETALAEELGRVKAQLEILELKEEDFEDDLEAEEEKLEEEMEAKEEAEEAIQEAEKEKQEVLDEATEEDIAVPAGTFETFDSLLAQANSAFAAGKFEEAKRLAKQAEKSLDRIEKAIENLEEAKEKEEELKEEQEEQEEKEREAIKEQDEKAREEMEKKVEQLEKEAEEAEEETRKAEEQLRESGEMNDEEEENEN